MTKARTLADNFAADINGITAGTGITGGGTSGTVTITNDMATTIAAKGDLVAGTANDTYAALTVGANNTVLTADSSTATGLKWATPAAGGMTLLDSGTLSGSSVTTASLSQSYNDLYVVIRNYRPATDAARLWLRINAVGSANTYTQGNISKQATLSFDETYIGLTTDVDNTVVSNLTTIRIPDYANSTTWKFAESTSVAVNATTTTSVSLSCAITGVTKETSAITTLQFLPGTGNFTSGDYYVYGVK